MKSFIPIVAFATGAMSHYVFPTMNFEGNWNQTFWSQVRPPRDIYSNGPVSDVTSADIQCNVGSSATPAPGVLSVTAGHVLSFPVSTIIGHPGPGLVYMARVPSGSAANTWTPSGNVWFKVAQFGVQTFSPMVWITDNWTTFNFTIPNNVPNGDYLVRVEHIALHTAGSLNGAQFFMSCGQVRVTGGGSGSPSPLVSFPGAYKADDPGILVSLWWPPFLNYTMPGPAVWTG